MISNRKGDICCVLLLVLLAVTYRVDAQRNVICPSEFNHQKNIGVLAADVSAGPKYFSGWNAGLGLQYYVRLSDRNSRVYEFPRQFLRASMFYARDQYLGVKHFSRGVDLAAGYTLFRVNHIAYGSVLLGGTYTQDEALEFPRPNLEVSNTNTSLFGGLAGFELSVFLGHYSNVSIVANFTQRILKETYWGNTRWYVGLGIRYHFIKMRPMSAAKMKF